MRSSKISMFFVIVLVIIILLLLLYAFGFLNEEKVKETTDKTFCYKWEEGDIRCVNKTSIKDWFSWKKVEDKHFENLNRNPSSIG